MHGADLYYLILPQLKLVLVVFDPLKMLEASVDGLLVGQEELEIEMKSFLVCLPISVEVEAAVDDRLSE